MQSYTNTICVFVTGKAGFTEDGGFSDPSGHPAVIRGKLLDQITDSCNIVITQIKCNNAKNDQL